MKPHKEVNIDFLNQCIQIYIGNKGKFSELCNTLNLEPPGISIASSYNKPIKHDGKSVWFIWLSRKSKYSLIHELSHVVDFIFDWYGFNDTELRAMLIEFIFKEYSK